MAKRLDYFLLNEDFLGTLTYCSSWVDCTHISDHYPVILGIGMDFRPSHYPFKYCHLWALDAYFIGLVRTLWNTMLMDLSSPAMIQLPGFLSLLKTKISPWLRDKKAHLTLVIRMVELAISSKLNCSFLETTDPSFMVEMEELELQKKNLLATEEAL